MHINLYLSLSILLIDTQLWTPGKLQKSLSYKFMKNVFPLPLRIDPFFPFRSVQFNSSVMSDSLLSHELQNTRPPCPSQIPGVYSNSCPSSQWCNPSISSSVVPFSSCPQSLPASRSFPMSQLFTWGGQSTGVSALVSVLPMNTQDLSTSGWTGWISLQSKRLSRVFSNTTVQKYQFFGSQLSSQSNSHIHTGPLEKPLPWPNRPCWQSNLRWLGHGGEVWQNVVHWRREW